MSQEKFYLTTAIAYASKKPHFGNTYEIIMADAVARFRRMMGKDVYFMTGTDEHGQKIESCAREAGIAPQAYVDEVSGVIAGIWDRMNTTYDRFIRTTDADHMEAVQKIFRRFVRQGDIYKGQYEGWYCTPDESFFTDTQVVDGKCPDCGRPVSRAKEEAYFFKMSAYADRLLQHIEANPGFIEPDSRKKEMVNNFLKAGLQDLCVSRTSFRWGIPVDIDPAHVVYVWLDALSNYITGLGYNPDLPYEAQSEHFRRYWPADVHIIGKDILRFHTIYWPIFLMALDLPLPKKIFGHPWFNAGEDKMSKSRGNVIYADELADLVSADGVRYYALAEMPYNSDGTISYEQVIGRYNMDLANNLGNLMSRTHAMTVKYFDGIVPPPAAPLPQDEPLLQTVAESVKVWQANMQSYHLADAAFAIFDIFRFANKYIDENTPWALAKDESRRDRLGTVLYHLLESLRVGAVLLTPFMPQTAERMFAQLGTTDTDYKSVLRFGALRPGGKLGAASPLFARIDEKAFFEGQAAKQAETSHENSQSTPVPPAGTSENPTAAPQSAADKTPSDAQSADTQGAAPEAPLTHEPEITIADFSKVELRVAQVLACEKVPRAKKLLKLQLDLGYETRQVVSGIARFYEPADLLGKKVVLVANLAPATICGVESRGMILASGDSPIRVLFPDPQTPLGERIR